MKTVTELYNLSSEVVGSGPFEDDEPMWITDKRYEWIQMTIMMLTCQDFVALAEQLWNLRNCPNTSTLRRYISTKRHLLWKQGILTLTKW